MTWIKTRSGELVDLLDPQPEQIVLEDIAYALSMNCRWNGHSNIFYSVAQHSVMCSAYTSANFALAALMHDASEAYLGDVVTPLKRLLGATYYDLEHKMMAVIAKKFKFQYPLPPEVEEVDHNYAVTEWVGLMGGAPSGLDMDFKEAPYDTHFMSWGPAVAYRLFMDRYRVLTNPHRLDTDTFHEVEAWNEQERKRLMDE